MTPKTTLLFSLLKPRRILLWLSIILAFIIFKHAFSNPTPHTNNDDNDSTKPRFLYRSRFRDNPDLEYEKRISNALQGIERAVLTENAGGDTLAEERIWQIARDEEQRGDDSRAFESRNGGWIYSVSLLPKLPEGNALDMADDRG